MTKDIAGPDPALSRELDAWLSGDRSRRAVLRQLLVASGYAAFGSTLAAGVARAAVDLASPDTPLGRVQAAAVKASRTGPADGSAYRAVQAAKKLPERHARA